MVREIRQEDREHYIKMAHDFYNSPAVLEPIPDGYIEAAFDECMRGDTYIKGYIIEYEGKIAGYGLTSKTFSQEAGGYVRWIEELYILSEYRSKGLGSEFFEYMEQTRSKDEKRFRLEVDTQNVRAASLYKKLGYRDFKYNQMIKTFN